MKLVDMLQTTPKHEPDGKLSAFIVVEAHQESAWRATVLSGILNLIAENGVPEDLQEVIDTLDKK